MFFVFLLYIFYYSFFLILYFYSVLIIFLLFNSPSPHSQTRPPHLCTRQSERNIKVIISGWEINLQTMLGFITANKMQIYFFSAFFFLFGPFSFKVELISPDQ